MTHESTLMPRCSERCTCALRAVRLGLPMMLGLIGGMIYHAQRLVDIYRAAGEQAGQAPDPSRCSQARSPPPSATP